MSTPPAIRKVSLDPAALAALEKDGDVKFTRPPPLKAQRVIRERVLKALYGPTMKPTFKQQLLGFPSYRALTAVWAASYWQRQQTAKKIIAGLHS